MGRDTDKPSTRARGITIRNNLFIDVSRERWGGPGDFLQIGNAPAHVVVEDNTVINDGRIINVYGGKGGERSEGFVFRRNVVRHNRYGVKGQSTATGTATLERFFPGGVFEGNVIGGGNRNAYPEKNGDRRGRGLRAPIRQCGDGGLPVAALLRQGRGDAHISRDS